MSWPVAADVGAPRRLAAGVARDGTLSPGERHVYLLHVGSGSVGRTLRVRAEQDGVDLVLELLGSAGATRRTIDSPSGRRGAERLLFTTDQEAPPRVAVRALAGETGRYRLRFEVAHEVSVIERRRLGAERLTMAADEAYAVGDGPSRRLALTRYVKALERWRALGADEEVARCLTHIGILRRLTDHPDSALTSLTEALAWWRRLGARHEQARGLNELGFIHHRLGDGEQALAHYHAALAIWRELDDARGAATTRNNIGLYHHRRGDPRVAGAHYEEALRLFRQIGDARREALALVNLGGVADVLGEPEAALDRYREGLSALRALDRPRDEARVLGNIAVVLRGVGRYQEAIDHYREALRIQSRLGARADEARTFSNLGATYLALGQTAAARDALEQALALRRRLGDRRGEAYTLNHLGDLARRQADPGAAAFYDRSLALHRATGDRRGEAQTLADLGILLGREGQMATARQRLDAAHQLAREIEDPGLECTVTFELGVLDGKAGEPERGLARLDEALRLARDTVRRGDQLRILIALAKAHRAGGDALRAKARIGEALGLVESLRVAVASPELRATFAAHRHEVFELAVGLAMEEHARAPRAGHEREAFALAERSRARSLLDLVHASGARVGGDLDPTLVTRRIRVVDRLALKTERQRALAARDPESASARAMDREIASLLRELEEVDDEIRRQSPRWRALIQPESLDAKAAQALLDPETLLLSYLLGEAHSFLFALTVDSLESHLLPARAVIEEAAQRLSAAWRVRDVGGGDETGLARDLADMLLGPVRDRLGARRLAVVAGGALHHLPFAALPRPGSGEPLIEAHEIVRLPSVSVLGLQRSLAAGRPPARGAVAVLADPVFDRRDPRFAGSSAVPAGSTAWRGPTLRGTADTYVSFDRLPWSQDEAKAIARHVPEADRLIARGFDAELTLVTGGRLSDFRVIHFATHGLIDNERPALSGLMLSGVDGEGRPRPGFLSLPAIYSLDLPADLVVLSGCRTALGEPLRGEGLWGLVQGFFNAGSARVMASLWQVEDRATAELMGRFYAALLGEGLPPAVALRQAQRSLRAERRWADPYHWAPFVLYGDWR